MPVAVLGLFQAATWTRYVRSAVLDVIRLDYVTTARRKGLGERGHRQARRAQRADPGRDAGRAADAGGLRRRHRHRADLPHPRHRLAADRRDPRNDTPVIMAVTFVFACLVILFNLIADILYGWLDPRISYR